MLVGGCGGGDESVVLVGGCGGGNESVVLVGGVESVVLVGGVESVVYTKFLTKTTQSCSFNII